MGSINPQGSTRGGADIVGGGIGEGPGPDIMAAATLDGNKVALHPDNHAIAFGGPGVGFIASDELNPQKARILLSLALLKHHRSPEELQALFATY